MQRLNLNPFPVLETERLLLRQLTNDDAQEIFIHRSDKRILEFIDIPVAKSMEDALAFISKINNFIAANESAYWGIQLKDRQEIIGSICLWNVDYEEEKAETGYVLHPDFQGKGYMQESITAVIEFGFQKLNLNKMVAEVHLDNLPSIKLLRRNGFAFDSVSEDCEIYSLQNPLQETVAG